MCGTPRARPTASIGSPASATAVEAVSHAPATPTPSDAYIKLSFRGAAGSASNFAAHLQMALQKQDWLAVERAIQIATRPTPIGDLTAGVAGLMKRVDATQRTADADLSVAFDDLNTLMGKAQEMANLAQGIATRLMTSNGADPDEREFNKMLMDMGLTSVVTREMAGSAYAEELARQLGDFVSKLLERRQTPLLTLADVYCVYNRARGSNLVSPHDLYQAARLCEPLGLPIILNRLPRGLLVLQARDKSDQAIIDRIVSRMANPTDSVDALDLASRERVSLTLALMLLEQAEVSGRIVRDISPSGSTKYYRNLILE